jgi:hypothetical protein
LLGASSIEINATKNELQIKEVLQIKVETYDYYYGGLLVYLSVVLREIEVLRVLLDNIGID